MKKTPAVLLLAASLLLCSSCAAGSNGIQYEKLNIDLALNTDQSTYCCYQDKKTILFSVGTKNDRSEGPSVDTDYIAAYDYKKQSVVKKYDLNSESEIISALPYGDGILYVDYTGVFETVNWSVVFMDDSGKKVLDQGTVASFDDAPYFQSVDNTPVYLWENDQGGHYACGVKKIVDFEAESIFEETSYKLDGLQISSNGKQYCYMASRDTDTYATFFIGDLSGILYEHPLSSKIISFAINGSYAICGLGDNPGGKEVFSVDAVNLKTGEAKSFGVDRALYRMSGGRGKTCLCVDNRYTAYFVDVEAGKIEKFALPKEIAERTWVGWSILFYPTGSSEYIVRFDGSGNRLQFYRMRV